MNKVFAEKDDSVAQIDVSSVQSRPLSGLPESGRGGKGGLSAFKLAQLDKEKNKNDEDDTH